MEINRYKVYTPLWNWWKSVDQYTIISLCILCAFSLMLVTTSGTAIAARIGMHESYFATRHVVYIVLAIITTFSISLFSKIDIKRIAILGFLLSIFLLILVKFYGYEAKGAKRWINFGGISMQPSEFMKPFFLVVTGWLLSTIQIEDPILKSPKIPKIGFFLTIILYLIVALLLITQPDFGMLIMISASLAVQLFIAGMPILWFIFAASFSTLGIITAYQFLPHVKQRIDNFFDPSSSDNYQVVKSLMAFKNGGMYGRGPGEGIVKQVLPDSHTDFIFAVAAEELGALACLMIVSIFIFVIVRGFFKLASESDRYTILAASGILSQLGFQAVINMGVNLNLLPTKGMTLPFISYGGSSTLAVAIAVGMLLSFTKRQTNLTKYKLQDIDI